jgi:hypothetical protein
MAALRKGQDVLVRTDDEPPAPARILADNNDGTYAVSWHGWSDEHVDPEVVRSRIDSDNSTLTTRLCAEVRRLERSGAWPLPRSGYVRHARERAPNICEACAKHVGRVADRCIMRPSGGVAGQYGADEPMRVVSHAHPCRPTVSRPR